MKTLQSKQHLFFIAVTIALGINSASALIKADSVKIYNLSKSIDIALQKNVLLDDAQKDIDLAQAEYLEKAHRKILPRLELRNVWGLSNKKRARFNPYGYLISPDDPDEIKNISYFTQAEVKFNQPIYSFNHYKYVAGAAQHDLFAEQADYLKQKNEIQLQIEQLYWGLVLGKESKRVIQNAQEKLDEVEEKLNAKLETGSGDVSQTDLFKLEMTKYEIKKRSREANTKTQIARSTLAMALGLSENDTFQIHTEYLEPVDFDLRDVEYYYEQALQNNPQLIKARERVERRRMVLLAERSQNYPQFFVGGDFIYNYAAGRYKTPNPFVTNNTNFFRVNLGIGFRQNLNFIALKDDIEIALVESEVAESRLANLEHEIHRQIETLCAQIKKADDKLRAGRRALRASNNWLNSESMTFDIGVGNIKELTDAYQANSAMKIENFQNIFEFNIAVAELKALVGNN